MKKLRLIFTKLKTHFLEEKHASSDDLPTTGFLGRYARWMGWILTPANGRPRRLAKLLFWVTLVTFFVLFPALGIFRRRMLPKSNVDQIYLWLDAPTATAFTKTQAIATGVVAFLGDFKSEQTVTRSFPFGKLRAKGTQDAQDDETKQYVSDLRIIDTISSRVGVAPTPDFANTFRGSMMREGEQYITMRINLLPKEQRKVSSEQFVMDLRPQLQAWLIKNYPDVKMRLLEDPPGPPVMSTFELKVKGPTTASYSSLETIATRLHNKIRPTLNEYDVVDHATTKATYQTNVLIQLDHEATSKAGLNAQQVAATVYTLFGGPTVAPYHDQTATEPVTIAVIAQDRFTRYGDVTFTNPSGQKIPLRSIAKIIPTSADLVRRHDDGAPSVSIYGEMGNNSVIYPIVSLIYDFLNDKNFREGRFDVVSRNLYGFTLRERGTDAMYTISFGGEWELSMNTFRDLGVALILSLLLLYVLVSARFKSFGLGGIVMLPFLLGFIGVLPGFSILYLLHNEYFSATSMIGVIALAGIAVGNSIILLEYVEELRHKGMAIGDALLKASVIRLKPIALTSVTAILGALMIVGDPVWSGLARALIRGLSVSASLTLILVPVFVYENVAGETP